MAEEETKKVETKSKKKKVGKIVGLSLLATAIVVPLGLAYGFLYVPESKYVPAKKGETLRTALAANVNDGLTNLVSDKKVSFVASEDDINTYTNLLRFNKYDFQKYITNMFFNFGENKALCLDIQIPLFKTRLKINVTPEVTDSELIFHINKYQLGRVNNIAGLIDLLCKNKTVPVEFNKMLGSMNINMTFDNANSCFRYPLQNLVYNLYQWGFNSVVGDSAYSGDNTGIYAALVSEATSRNDTNFYTDKFGFESNLSSFFVKGPYVIDSYNNALPIKSIIDSKFDAAFAADLIGIDDDENTITQAKLLKFLAVGYKGLNETEQTNYEQIDFSSVGIDDVKTYVGTFDNTHSEDESITNLLIDKIDSAIENKGNNIKTGDSITVSIDEDEFRKAYLDSEMLFAGVISEKDKTSERHYAITDDFYANFTDGQINLVSTQNIDGLSLDRTITFKDENTVDKEDNVFRLKFNKSLIGNIETNKNATVAYAGFLNSCFDHEYGLIHFGYSVSAKNYLKIEPEDYELIFDFENVIEESKLLEYIKEHDLKYETALSFDDTSMNLKITFEVNE